MKRFIKYIIFFILFTLGPMVFPSDYKLYNVLKVTDGDTLVIDINRNNVYDKMPDKEACRLIGVSTTELGKFKSRIPESGALDATHFLRGVLAAVVNQVSFVYDPTISRTDKSNRQLVYAYLPDGESINELILTSGYGIVYLKYDYDEKMKEKMINCTYEAYKNKTGLWVDKVIRTYWIEELKKDGVDMAKRGIIP